MSELIWILPVLFMIHEMEEIIMINPWKKRIEDKNNLKNGLFNGFLSTESFSLAVAEEFLLIIIICIYSVITNNWGLWLGAFLGNTLHLIFMHILGGTIYYKKYVPGVVTAIITVIPSIYYISYAIDLLQYPLNKIIMWAVIGILVVVINLKILHVNMIRFHNWLYVGK